MTPEVRNIDFFVSHENISVFKTVVELDCGVGGLGFKSPSSILLEKKPVLCHEWSGMMETHALYRKVGKKFSYGVVFDFAVEQPQLFRKLH